MAADLHIHTTFSDGTDTPEEVVEKARAAGLDTISITDHDTVNGIDRAIASGKMSGVNVIPGVELTTETPDYEVHILGYFIEHKSEELKAVLGKIRNSRVDRIFEMVGKLKKLGINIDAKKVLDLSGGGSPGRPHVARAMVEAGAVDSVREAFDKYIDSEGPAYVPHYKLSPDEAIKLILASSGVPVYAHPAISKSDSMIPDLISSGLKGLEVYYGGHSGEDAKRYFNLAKKYGLLMTGGSDYHGTQSVREIKLGDVAIPEDLVKKLASARGGWNGQ